MRFTKRLVLLVYVLACAVCLTAGAYGLLPHAVLPTLPIDLHAQPARVAMGVSLCVIGVSGVAALLRALFSPRPAPRAVHPVGSDNIEVAVRALESSVRAAVEEDGSFLVECAEGSVRRRKPQEARFSVEVIPLVEHDVRAAARAAQERAAAACERLVGAPCAAVRVKVLPAKTVIVQKGLDDE